MKIPYLWSTALTIGIAMLTSVAVARADDPKPDHRRAAAKKAAATNTAAVDRSGHVEKVNGRFPSRDGRDSRVVTGGTVGGANGIEYRVPTGSMIPQRYRRDGYGTDTSQNLFIYGQNDIRLQSHDTPAEGLRSVPGVTVSGPRGQ